MTKLGHIITGPDGSFETWSETVPRLIGVEAAQLSRSTRAWLDIIHPHGRATFRDRSIEAGKDLQPVRQAGGLALARLGGDAAPGP